MNKDSELCQTLGSERRICAMLAVIHNDRQEYDAAWSNWW